MAGKIRIRKPKKTRSRDNLEKKAEKIKVVASRLPSDSAAVFRAVSHVPPQSHLTIHIEGKIALIINNMTSGERFSGDDDFK